MIAMAHTLDIKVIAADVETTLQQDLLKNMMCDLVQGYLYSRHCQRKSLLLNGGRKIVYTAQQNRCFCLFLAFSDW